MTCKFYFAFFLNCILVVLSNTKILCVEIIFSNVFLVKIILISFNCFLNIYWYDGHIGQI